MKIIKKRFVSLICICLIMADVILSAGCSQKEIYDKDGDSITGFAFNTTYTITLIEGGSQDILNECVSKCSDYERIFSRTLKGSELYNINEISDAYMEVIGSRVKKGKNNPSEDALVYGYKIESLTELINSKISVDNTIKYSIEKNGSIAFEVSDIMYEILEKGLYYSEMSEGKFDITIEPVSSLWNFTSDSPKVPDEKIIETALTYVGYKQAELKEGKLIFEKPGMGIELGGIAKGFIADCLKEFLIDKGVTSGTINLGGNVLCIGKKSDGNPFCIGIQQPFADRNEVIAAINAEDVSIVSSGVYERYFEEDGKLYHHILNPATGYSYDNEVIAVTIVTKKSADGDALSTTCFALGTDKGMELIESIEDTEAVFITEDEKMHYSDGFKSMLAEN